MRTLHEAFNAFCQGAKIDVELNFRWNVHFCLQEQEGLVSIEWTRSDATTGARQLVGIHWSPVMESLVEDFITTSETAKYTGAFFHYRKDDSLAANTHREATEVCR